jgi:DNA gyrase inhibitor GyrI
MILIKETKRLFMDKYSHKVVLVVPAAPWFRGSEFPNIKDRFKNFQFGAVTGSYVTTRIRTQEDFDFSYSLYKAIAKMSDYEIRVESPCISFYTNTVADVEKLMKIGKDRVKYISKPAANTVLTAKTVLMSRTGYDYKITLGSTRQSFNDFIEWADATGLAHLTKSTRRELTRNSSWGGTYFYVKHDKALTMTKMFLGQCISRIDQVVKHSS